MRSQELKCFCYGSHATCPSAQFLYHDLQGSQMQMWCYLSSSLWCFTIVVVNVCWELNAPSDKVNFMDLTITITEGKISTSLFEKPLNLHLYIPPHSVHPPGLLPGIVHSTIF